MAITVPNQWTSTDTTHGAELLIAPTPGNWLVAVVTLKMTDGSNPQISVGDYARNMWTLVYSGLVTAAANNTGSQLQAQVWVAPAIQYPGWSLLGVYTYVVYSSANDVGSACIDVFEVAGMTGGYLTVDSVTVATASGATTLSITLPTPTGGADCLMVGVAGTDNAAGNTTVSSAGWTSLTQVSNTVPNSVNTSAWRESTASQTVSWSSTVSTNWAACAVAIRQTGVGPAQLSSNWPPVEFQLGFGQGLSTPISAVRWTTLPNRLMQFDTQRGIQYELGFVQSSPTDIALRNDDGALSPRTGGSGTAVANGSTTTLVVSNSDGATMTVGDFFQLKSAGAFKELNVFQITSIVVGTNTTVTFQRADGVAGGATASTATGDTYSACPIDVYLPYRILASWNGVKYPVSVGWIERWPQVWSDPHWGVVNAVGIDVIATLVAADQSMLRGEILRRSPNSYWPTDDKSGSTQAANYGSVSTALVSTTMNNGGGANGSATFANSTQRVANKANSSDPAKLFTTLVGDAGTAWNSTGLTVAETNASDGFALVATPGNDSTFPSITNGVTIVLVYFADQAWINAIGSAPNLTYDPTLFICRSSVGTGAAATQIKLSWNGPTGANFQKLKITVWDKNTHASTTTVLSNLLGSGANFATYAVTFNQTTWNAYLGTLGGWLHSGSGTCNLAATWGLLNVGGEADSTSQGFCSPGMYAHIAVFNRMLTSGELQDIGRAVQSSQPIDPGTNDVIRRKLAFVNWSGAKVLNFTSYLTGSDYPASTIAEKVANLADGEGGFLFSDAAGQLQFRGNARAAAQGIRATIGDNPGGGSEIPFVGGSGDFEVDFDPTYLYNSIVLTNTGVLNGDQTGGANPTSVFRVKDNTSIAKYGLRTLGKTVALQNDSDASNLASSYLTTYAYPKKRVSTVKIDVFKTSQWAFALGVEVGDVIVVNRRPIGAPPISITCVVLSVKHDVDPLVKWETTLILRPR